MKWRALTGRPLLAAMLAGSLALGGATACRTTTDDIHRWGNTVQGPRKLVAVLMHDKYPTPLRVEAAMTLVRMRPRSGQRVGIDRLVEALNEMNATGRAKIVAGIVPQLTKEIRKPPPGGDKEDTTFPYKDAAFALLTNDGAVLVTNEEHQKQLKSALEEWVMGDFAARTDDSSQKYGMPQVLQLLGAAGVKRLPELIKPEAKKIDRIAESVADLGDAETKLKTSKKLVDVAKTVSSEAWLKEKAPQLKKANEASGYKKVSEDRFKKQLDQFQEEELLRTFASMKKVGQAPIVDFLLDFAANKSNPEARRAAALAAMEGHVDKKNEAHAKKLMNLAGGNDTPDPVREQALRRLGELPRKVVVNDLYKLFEHDNWKVRWMAAELVLKTSDTGHVAEFMRHLKSAEHMAMTEPLRYGELIGKLKGKQKPEDVLQPYLQGRSGVQGQLSALGYYYTVGTKEQIGKVSGLKGSTKDVPECAEDAKDCEWKCQYGEGKKAAVKEISTVGEFVQYCVIPAMEKRTAEKKPEKGKEAGADKK